MASTNKDQSDREDGEIIEDEFEDISDNSMILTSVGKCISPKEHLPEISLSSVSETEDMGKIKHQRCRMSRSRRTHRKRKYSHRKTICIDSDSDTYVELDRKLLRAAIHIDNQDCLRNSLHTRLKAMSEVGDDLNKKHEEDLSKKEIESHNISSDEGDDDLIQLRLEALRTAVLNKFKHRKKTKCKDISESDGFEGMFSDNSEKINDKENTVDFDNEDKVEPIVTKSTQILPENQGYTDSDAQNNASQDEDEDVLRALLLASLSKKISKENNIENLQLQPPNVIKDIYSYKADQHIDKKCFNTNPYKKTSVVSKKNLPLKHSKVQPIIININCDSDTEDESQNKSSNLLQKGPNLAIENSVEKFLKEQRAKVEAEHTKNGSFKSDLFNKSSLKLLPKIKQIEYHNLLKKLQDAQKLKRQKVKGTNCSEDKLLSKPTLQNGVELVKKPFNPRKNRIQNLEIKPDLKAQLQYSEQIPDLRNEVRILHKVLKEIQTQKSERLQMQTKYTSLTPIVKKINEASIERKKYDKEIGRLLGELSEAKKKLCETHINISACVKELIRKKEEIDKQSINNPDFMPRVNNTSTPLRDQNPSKIFPNKINTHPVETNNVKNDNKLANSRIMENNIEHIGTEMDISNDMEPGYNQTNGVVPKYISPLDNIARFDMDDPFVIMCPYDIDGNCRDSECVYKHYPSSQ